MAHSFTVFYNIHIFDHDPFSKNEEGKWNTSTAKEVHPGGSAVSWGFDEEVDGEVRFKIDLSFSLTSGYQMNVSGRMDMWENQKGHVKNNIRVSGALRASDTKKTELVLVDQKLKDGNDWVQVYVRIEQAIKPVQFNPKLSFQLSQIELKKEYYLTSPKQVDLKSLSFKCLGVSNSISNLSLDFSASNKVTLNKKLGSKTVSFPDLINPLNGQANKNVNHLQVNIREHYAWYLPTSLTSFESTPKLNARIEDKGKSFGKYVKVTGPDKPDTLQFSVQLGYQYVLFFEVTISYNQTLVSNESTNVGNYTLAVDHYLGEIGKYLKTLPENTLISIEVENVDPKPKVVSGKTISVVKETQKGRNLTFRDGDGYTMGREEFVSAIKQGLYPGYHIRKIRGIETPVSDPDNTSKNNLG